MLLHKGTAAEWEAPSPRTPSVSEGAALLALVMELTGELSIAPRVYRLESEPSLWVHFPAACFDCRGFLEEYGGAMSYIHGRYPMAVYGTAEDGESAELSAVRTARNTILYKKRNLSRKDFDRLSDLCVKIGMSDPRLMPVLEDTLRHIVPGRSIVAVPRTPCTAALFGGLPEMNPDTAFAYFNLDRNSDAANPLDVLSVEQKKTLWLLFLEDGVSAVELPICSSRPNAAKCPCSPGNSRCASHWIRPASGWPMNRPDFRLQAPAVPDSASIISQGPRRKNCFSKFSSRSAWDRMDSRDDGVPDERRVRYAESTAGSGCSASADPDR